jgi:hypothetical protein
MAYRVLNVRACHGFFGIRFADVERLVKRCLEHEDPGGTIYSFQIDRDEILYHTEWDMEYIKFLQERGAPKQ